MQLSPIEKVNNIFIKREDLAIFDNINGGKGRVITEFINDGLNQGYTKFVTCGSRDSVQCEMVSAICEYHNLQCYLFMPNGQDTAVLKQIYKNSNTELIRTKVGYTNVLKRWSFDYAQEHNYFYIPFALECEKTIQINQEQVQNIPNQVKRIVVPIGSGMNFISIIKGLEKYNINIPVIGIQVGLNPAKNIQIFLNDTPIQYEIIKSELPYNKKPKIYHIENIELNQTYEAKCIPFLQNDDLLWIVGKDL